MPFMDTLSIIDYAVAFECSMGTVNHRPSSSVIQIEVAIGRVGLGSAGLKPGRAKFGPVFSGQNFNSPAHPKNQAGRAK